MHIEPRLLVFTKGVRGRIAAAVGLGLFSVGMGVARLGAPASPLAYEELVEQTLDALAAHLEAHLDVDQLLSLAR